jgi:hypothetical protein
MPTLPLYTPPDVADASYRVVAPGGYEWWHFDAESDSGDVVVVARLGAGFLYHPEYVRRYQSYRRRPTRHPPPVPSEYPCVEFVVFDGTRLVARHATHFPPREFEADYARPWVRVGPNELLDGDDGLRLRLHGADEGAGVTMTMDLRFRPLLPRRALDVEAAVQPPGRHHWLIVDPLCEVTGEIRLAGGRNGRELHFRGRGCHDHCFGTQPIGLSARRCRRGRVLLADRALCYQVAEPADARRTPVAAVVEAGAAGVRSVPVLQARHGEALGKPPLLVWPQELGLAVSDPPRTLGSLGHSEVVAFAASAGAEAGRGLFEIIEYSRAAGR